MSADAVTGTDHVRSPRSPQCSYSGGFAWGVLLLEFPQTYQWWEEGVLSDFHDSRQSALSYQYKPRDDHLIGLLSHLRTINRRNFFPPQDSAPIETCSHLFQKPTA